MLIKLIGGLLVVSASGLIGILLSNRLSIRHKELKNLRSFMQMLETEVTYGATPLPAALINISKKTEGLISSFFRSVSQSLTERSFYTVGDAWSNAADASFAGSAFQRSDIELVKSFGNVLGCSDREDQIKYFKLFYVQIKHQEDAALEEINRSSKMYRSLGFLLGIAIFVVLV